MGGWVGRGRGVTGTVTLPMLGNGLMYKQNDADSVFFGGEKLSDPFLSVLV